jgi:hypothetical protein
MRKMRRAVMGETPAVPGSNQKEERRKMAAALTRKGNATVPLRRRIDAEFRQARKGQG